MRAPQKGFTITELLIASSVFSVVLLVALAGFLQIGHTFYRGVTLAQTQENASHVFQDITGNFLTAISISPPQSGNNYHYFCVGSTRYTYNQGKEVGLGGTLDHSSTGNFGILKDSLPGGSACAVPCSDTGPVVCGSPSYATLGKYSSVVELLGDRMRLADLSITNPNPQAINLYSVNIVVAYGDDDTMNLTTPTAPVCKGDNGSDFCAVSQINTTVYRGWHQ